MPRILFALQLCISIPYNDLCTCNGEGSQSQNCDSPQHSGTMDNASWKIDQDIQKFSLPKCYSQATIDYSSSINSPVRRILYDFTPSGFLNQVCLCRAKLSISGVGITGIIPNLMIALPGNASTFDMTGLGNRHQLPILLNSSILGRQLTFHPQHRNIGIQGYHCW